MPTFCQAVEIFQPYGLLSFHCHLKEAVARKDRYAFGQRETEILTLIGQGLTNGAIAKRLHISLGTVKGHIKSIRKIVGLHESPKTLHSIIQSIFSEETKQQENIAENEGVR